MELWVAWKTHLGLEESTVVEELFHSHVRDDTAGLTLDDAFHNVLHMVPPCGDGSSASGADLTIRVAGEKHSILLERRLVIVRSNSEDSGHCVFC